MLLPLMPLRNPTSRSLAAEFNATSLAPKSAPSSIIIVIVITRERVESIRTTHLLKNNLVRSSVVVAAIQDLQRAADSTIGRVVCSEFRRRRFLEKLSGGGFLHSSFFRSKAARQTELRAASAATLGRAVRRAPKS